MSDQLYSTSDLDLTACLRAQRHKILNVRAEAGRGTFEFSNTESLQRDIRKFINDEPVPFSPRNF